MRRSLAQIQISRPCLFPFPLTFCLWRGIGYPNTTPINLRLGNSRAFSFQTCHVNYVEAALSDSAMCVQGPSGSCANASTQAEKSVDVTAAGSSSAESKSSDEAKSSMHDVSAGKNWIPLSPPPCSASSSRSTTGLAGHHPASSFASPSNRHLSTIITTCHLCRIQAAPGIFRPNPTINTSYASPFSSIPMQGEHSASSLSLDGRPATGYSISDSSMPYDDHFQRDYSRPNSSRRPISPVRPRFLSIRRPRHHSQAMSLYPSPYEDQRPSP